MLHRGRERIWQCECSTEGERERENITVWMFYTERERERTSQCECSTEEERENITGWMFHREREREHHSVNASIAPKWGLFKCYILNWSKYSVYLYSVYHVSRTLCWDSLSEQLSTCNRHFVWLFRVESCRLGTGAVSWPSSWVTLCTSTTGYGIWGWLLAFTCSLRKACSECRSVKHSVLLFLFWAQMVFILDFKLLLQVDSGSPPGSIVIDSEMVEHLLITVMKSATFGE